VWWSVSQHPLVAAWTSYGIASALTWGNTSVGTLLLAVIVLAGQWFSRRRTQNIQITLDGKTKALEDRIVQLETTIEASDKDVPATTRETGR
jgi:hypothetical protein